MSFGFSVGDFIAVAGLAANLYFSYKEAPSDYREICRQLLTVYTTLGQLQFSIHDPSSIIYRCSEGQQENLKTTVKNCEETLRQLDDVRTKYTKLDKKTRRLSWSRIKFAKEDVSAFQGALSTHLHNISIYLTGVGHASLARIEERLETLTRIEERINQLYEEIKRAKEGLKGNSYEVPVQRNTRSRSDSFAIVLASQSGISFVGGRHL